MRQSVSRGRGSHAHGVRRAAAFAVVAALVAGCGAAAGVAAQSTSPAPTATPTAASGHSTSATAGPTPSPFPITAAGRSPRIMIVGDSITKGSSGDYTWQYRLYKHLRAAGLHPRMVGPYHALYNNMTRKENDHSYANPRFGHANDATWGMTLLKEKNKIGAKVATYRPDYLLVMLGLDDLFWFGVSQADMAANLKSFISAARSTRPHIRIMLGVIPPDIHTQTSPAFATKVATFNTTIEATAAQLSTSAAPIVVVRDGAGLSVTADLWDGTHLNANGEIKVAAAFSDVLAARFQLGSAYPTPYPVLPTGPLVHPRLKVRRLHALGQAKLSWTLVPGANTYRVFTKDLSLDQTSFKELPFPLTPAQDPWTAGLLTSGDSYAFKLQACKGTDCHAYSNVARITAP